MWNLITNVAQEAEKHKKQIKFKDMQRCKRLTDYGATRNAVIDFHTTMRGKKPIKEVKDNESTQTKLYKMDW